MAKTRIHAAGAQHRALRDGILAVLRKHKTVPAIEMLALASHLVGQILALQDQRIVTPELALEIIKKNIEQGNQEAVAGVLGPHQGSA